MQVVTKWKESIKQSRVAGNESGFTLTEMLIVVAIIAMIGTFAVGKISAQFNKAKVDATKIKIKNLASTLETYRLDCNVFPTTEQGLDALVTKPVGGRDCKNYNTEGYMKQVPKDSWDTDFVYESDGQKFTIKSFGQDLVEGGEGNAADITSDTI